MHETSSDHVWRVVPKQLHDRSRANPTRLRHAGAEGASYCERAPPRISRLSVGVRSWDDIPPQRIRGGAPLVALALLCPGVARPPRSLYVPLPPSQTRDFLDRTYDGAVAL